MIKSVFAELTPEYRTLLEQVRGKSRRTIKVLILEAIEELARKYEVPFHRYEDGCDSQVIQSVVANVNRRSK